MSSSGDEFCNYSIDSELKPVLATFCISGCVSCMLCVLAIIVMILMRAYRLLIHRLILYLIVSIVLFTLAIVTQISGYLLDYWHTKDHPLCVFEGFALEYAGWLMLLATLMVTLHMLVLVIFQRCHENIHNLEILYVTLPYIIPIFISLVPFINNNYGISGPWCWMRLYNDDCSLNIAGAIEVYALWYGELSIGLILNNIALVVILIIMCKRSRDVNTSLAYSKAIKQTLPLIVYPFTYQLLSLYAIANRIYQAIHKGHIYKWMFIVHSATAPSWGYFAPVFTIIYMIVFHKSSKKFFSKIKAKCFSRVVSSTNHHQPINDDDDDDVNRKLMDTNDHLTRYGVTTVTHPTAYDIPTESELDDNDKYEHLS